MNWSIEHFQTYLFGCHFKVCTDNNPLTYFITSPNMDATKQRWINKLAKYDFSLEYQEGKNNTVAEAPSRISKDMRKLRGCSKQSPSSLGMIVFEVFKEKEEDQQPEKAASQTMSSEAMKAVFDNLTSGAGRRAEQEYNIDSATHCKADSHQGECEISTVKYSNACHRLG